MEDRDGLGANLPYLGTLPHLQTNVNAMISTGIKTRYGLLDMSSPPSRRLLRGSHLGPRSSRYDGLRVHEAEATFGARFRVVELHNLSVLSEV